MWANKHKRYLTGIAYSIYKINHQRKRDPKSDKRERGEGIQKMLKEDIGRVGGKKERREKNFSVSHGCLRI